VIGVLLLGQRCGSDPGILQAGAEVVRRGPSWMTTPPEGGGYTAERARPPALDEPEREWPDAILAGGICRGGASGAMLYAWR
jgi:hypothetical protein